MRFLILLLFTLFSLSSWSGPHKVIDLKLMSDADGAEREISICARPSPSTVVPGHMFIAFSLLDKEGKRDYSSVGHTTSVTTAKALLSFNGILAPVAGYIGEERYTSTKEKCLVLKVNKDDYKNAFALAQPNISDLILGLTAPDAQHPVLLNYTLGENDCMGLAIQVVKAFVSKGVKVPERKITELPLAYLRRLIDSN